MKKFLNNFFTTIAIIILFWGTLGLLILIPVKTIIGKNSIKNVITNIDIEKNWQENPDFKKNVDELLEPVLEEAKDFGIKEEVIIKIIDSKQVKSFLGDIASNVTDYFLTGDNQKIVNTNDIVNLVSSTIEELNTNKIINLSEKETKNILDITEKYVKEYEEFIPEASIIEENLTPTEEKDLALVRFVLGNDLLYILIAIEVISLIGVLLLKHQEFKGLKYSAITILIASSIMGIIFTLIYFYQDKVIGMLPDYLQNIINHNLFNTIYLYLGIILLMIIILISYKFIKKRVTKNVQAAA